MDPELMQTLMQNPERGRELFQAMLAERAAANPGLATMMQLMQQRESQREPARDLDAREPSPRIRVDRVRARVNEMRGELVRLRELVGRFAAAVGACSVCWGADEVCRSCGGDGTPGWLDPDPIAFTQLVAPAVSRLADANPDAGDGD